MDITVEELRMKLDGKEQFEFIDVREQYEFDEFNLGAKLIPLGELMTRLADISENKGLEIIVHCRSGSRSAMAKTLLMQAGYHNVRNLLGGVLEWKEKFGAQKI